MNSSDDLTYRVDVPLRTSHISHLKASGEFLYVHTEQSQNPSSQCLARRLDLKNKINTSSTQFCTSSQGQFRSRWPSSVGKISHTKNRNKSAESKLVSLFPWYIAYLPELRLSSMGSNGARSPAICRETSHREPASLRSTKMAALAWSCDVKWPIKLAYAGVGKSVTTSGGNSPRCPLCLQTCPDSDLLFTLITRCQKYSTLRKLCVM